MATLVLLRLIDQRLSGDTRLAGSTAGPAEIPVNIILSLSQSTGILSLFREIILLATHYDNRSSGLKFLGTNPGPNTLHFMRSAALTIR